MRSFLLALLRRHRLVQTVVYWAPESLQADAQRWSGEVFEAHLADAKLFSALLHMLIYARQTPCHLVNPFRRWFLAVLRGREPGEFPRNAWICHLQLSIGDRIRVIVEAEPQLFAPHRQALLALCAPRFP